MNAGRLKAGWKILCAAGLSLVACDGQSTPEELWRPWYEAPIVEPIEPVEPLPDMRSSTADGGPTPGGCTLSVSVTTSSPGGRYSPRNIGAIWISDGNDRFIKTLNVWAAQRAKYLTRWNAATAAASVPGNRTDAISGATKGSHGVRTASWNCTNFAAKPVADGPYKICFELTDYDGPGPYDCVTLSKSPAPVTLTPADVASFKARKLELSP
jgi:hypothetical protein